MYVFAGTTTSSPAPIPSASSAIFQRGGSGLDADAMARSGEPRELALEAIDLGPHDEARALQHFVDRRPDVGLDRRVLRLEVYERNVHGCKLLSEGGGPRSFPVLRASMRMLLLRRDSERRTFGTRLPGAANLKRTFPARILQSDSLSWRKVWRPQNRY